MVINDDAVDDSFHRSSMVEQSTVNRLVVGSNPAGGASLR